MKECFNSALAEWNRELNMSGDKNSLWNKEKYLCLMKNPFTVCCGISYLNSNMRNPPDAEKLSDDEAKFYIDNLKGSIQLFHFAFKN